MNKKFYIVSLLIIANLVASYYWIIKAPEHHVYSEEVISNAAKELDKNLLVLFRKIDTEFNLIEKNSNVENFSLNECNQYFLKLFDKEDYFNSLLFTQNQKKYFIVRDKESVITTCDSTPTIDIVKWSRFESNKKVSEWDEIFDKESYQFDWVDKINLKKNEYSWVKHQAATKGGTILLLAKSWEKNNNKYTLAGKFQKTKLHKYFKSINNFERFSIIVRTDDGQIFKVASKQNADEDTVAFDQKFKKAIDRGLSKLSGDDSKIFSYPFNKETYWAAVRQFNSTLGIKDIIISIPETAIESLNQKKTSFRYLYFLFTILVSLTILFWLYRKSVRVPNFMIGRNKKVSINTILKDNENRHLEFKSSLRWDYRQEKANPDLELVILKTIAAFGNSDGGILLIGVDDDKNILGLENDYKTLKKPNSDYYEIYMRNLFHKYFGIKYTTENIRMDFIKDGAKEVCLIEVFKADEPLYMKVKDKSGKMVEKFYVRSGNSSQQIDSLKDINDYIFDRFKKNNG